LILRIDSRLMGAAGSRLLTTMAGRCSPSCRRYGATTSPRSGLATGNGGIHCLTIALFNTTDYLVNRIGRVGVLVLALILYPALFMAGALIAKFLALLVTRSLLGAAVVRCRGYCGCWEALKVRRSKALGYTTSTPDNHCIIFPLLGG